jgi:hypothetical protein
MCSSLPANDELESFLSRVHDISSVIEGLKEGTIDLNDKRLIEAERNNNSDKRTEAKEESINHRPGRGIAEDYTDYCNVCKLEYLIPASTCASCDSATISSAARRSYLQLKVKELLNDKQQRKENRLRFETAASAHKSSSQLDYSVWNFFEDDSDDEEIMNNPHPNLLAMEADLQERNRQRNERAKQAEQLKAIGNQLFQSKKYLEAISKYSEAIELKRDDKSYYTNRALAYLHINNYDDAIKDSNTALDIWDYIDNKKGAVNKSFAIKALLRRAEAKRLKSLFTEAADDIQIIFELLHNDQSNKKQYDEAKRLLSLVQEQIGEKQHEMELTQQRQLHDNNFAIITNFIANLQSTQINLDVESVRNLLMSDEVYNIHFKAAGGIGRLIAAAQANPRLSSLFSSLLLNHTNKLEFVLNNGADLLIELLNRDSEQKQEFNPQELSAAAANLYLITQYTASRDELIKHIVKLDGLISKQLQRKLSTELLTNISLLLANLAYDNNTKAYWRNSILQSTKNCGINILLELLLCIEPIMNKYLYTARENTSLLAAVLSALTNLLTDVQLRNHFALSSDYSAAASLVNLVNAVFEGEYKKNSELLEKTLGLAMNCSLEENLSTPLYNSCGHIIPILIDLIENNSTASTLRERCLGFISRGLKHSSIEDKFLKQRGIELVLNLLANSSNSEKNEMMTEYCIRSVAVCLSHNSNISAAIEQFKYQAENKTLSGFDLLICFLSHHNSNIAGNSSLCISHCAKNVNNVPKLHSAIIPLITLMKAGKSSSANAAIACAKLSSDPKNLAAIKAHRGIEIMASISQSVLKQS